MREYDLDLRSAVHTILHCYTRFDGKPLSLKRSHRVLTLFAGLKTESVTSFLIRSNHSTPDLPTRAPRILVFESVATREDFRQRMIDQIRRYLKLKSMGLSPEWEAFCERNRAEINRLSSLINLAQSCVYQETS